MLIANWDSVLLVIVFVVGMLVMLKMGYIKQVRHILFYLVTEAEATFGAGTGTLKYAAVTTWLYEKLPTVAKVVLTAAKVDELIEDAVTRMKVYLEENPHAQELIK
jgi:hypothetical protein